MDLTKKPFREIDLADPFFDSLKADYTEFSQWYARKSDDNAEAYAFTDEAGALDGFLYMKVETGPVADVEPPLPAARRLKVGTMKINAHGTKLGERFIKKIFDTAVQESAVEMYVTIFEKHQGLNALFERYGFRTIGRKTSANGVELVKARALQAPYTDVVASYPLVQLHDVQCYLLALQPQWHTRLLPDSILRTEDADIVQDLSHTNSIHKVYLAAMPGMDNLRRGDVLLIYRTSDGQGPARFRSVATSICCVEEYRSLSSFGSKDEFLAYCRPHSVFDERELNEFWARRRYPHIIRFTYNIALRRRPTRGQLIDEVGIPEGTRWGFLHITTAQMLHVARLGGIDESLVIH